MKYAVVASVFVCTLVACSGGNQSSSQASSSPSAAPALTAPATVAAAAASAPPASAAPAGTATPTADPLAAVHFTDISGTFAETRIKQEAVVGVFGKMDGKFNPYGPLTRAEFVRWLVRSNNAIFKSDQSKQIRLADPSSDQSFVDVPKSNPDFQYIQGLANAGFVIGIDKNHFAPSRNITREELVAIYATRCIGTIKPASEAQMAGDTGLSDADQVSKPYWAVLDADHWSGLFGSYGSLSRIYGSIKTFHPHKLATRSDAATAVAVFMASDVASAVPH